VLVTGAAGGLAMWTAFTPFRYIRGDPEGPRLQRLAQHLQAAAVELGKLVEEEDTLPVVS